MFQNISAYLSALALALTNRVPVIAILGLAAIVGILIY